MGVVKESSDDLSAPESMNEAFPARSSRKRTMRDYAALALATCGVGFMPIAPGTWGSMASVGIFYAARKFNTLLINSDAGFVASDRLPLEAFRTLIFLSGLVALTLAGVWAATRAETLLNRKDPGAVVIDEVVGQLITFLVVPFDAGWKIVLAGFLMFRLFDIWKPYPVRALESLPAGLGIMADDVLAGAYAATAMAALVWISYLL
ncbi:MAG: phosphatidylglycerophosphatase A [Pyrinomonadaceae bacterium]